MTTDSTARVAVVGASYGGLCTALAMQCVGADVHVYERSSDVHRIGGGIVVQPDFAEYLETFGYARPEVVAVPTTRRRFLSRDGSTNYTARDSTFYTGWDTVLRALRDNVQPERLHYRQPVRTVQTNSDAAVLAFEDGTTKSFDLVVAADGIGSIVRRSLEPDIAPVFAGYAGFRGLIDESDLDQESIDLFESSFVLFDYPGSHILCYFIPGESGSLEPGHRRLNWVWYAGVDEAELPSLLTDRSGHTHRSSLGPGEMGDAWKTRIAEKAEQNLPPILAVMVHMTDEPFAQGIFDLAVASMVHGRTVLLGDAAFLVRPHTASGASKAAGDAVSLAHAIDGAGVTEASLKSWETERRAVAERIVQRGLSIAARSKLGLGTDGKV